MGSWSIFGRLEPTFLAGVALIGLTEATGGMTLAFRASGAEVAGHERSRGGDLDSRRCQGRGGRPPGRGHGWSDLR